jgi:hypothetical protein
MAKTNSNALLNLQPIRLAVGDHVYVAALATKDRAAAGHLRRKLEMRFLTLFEACWAKPNEVVPRHGPLA